MKIKHNSSQFLSIPVIPVFLLFLSFLIPFLASLRNVEGMGWNAGITSLDPTASSYNGKTLRQWVARCIENEKLEAPPKKRGKPSKRVKLGTAFHRGTITSANADEFEIRRVSVLPQSEHDFTGVVNIT